MFLDHRVIAKISSLLSKISMNVMLLDNNGQVILPEDNNREFTLPEVLRQNPTAPLVYGGFTLIGTEGTHPLFLCLPGDSQDVSNCAILCAEMINMLTKVDLPHADREQSLRCILREEVEGAELESLAMEHTIPLEKSRCVVASAPVQRGHGNDAQHSGECRARSRRRLDRGDRPPYGGSDQADRRAG